MVETMPNPQINQDKYDNAVLYFVKYCNNCYLGATKLNKLLYYLDFISYRDTKNQVTGDVYIHKQYGPVPSKVDEILTKLHTEKKIEIKILPYKDGETYEYQALQAPDTNIFSKFEIELMDKICQEFSMWPTDKIVNQTHLEAPWFYSTPYQVVDFDYANDIEFFK